MWKNKELGYLRAASLMSCEPAPSRPRLSSGHLTVPCSPPAHSHSQSDVHRHIRLHYAASWELWRLPPGCDVSSVTRLGRARVSWHPVLPAPHTTATEGHRQLMAPHSTHTRPRHPPHPLPTLPATCFQPTTLLPPFSSRLSPDTTDLTSHPLRSVMVAL